MIDRITPGVPVQIEPARQANGVFLREPTARRIIVQVPLINLPGRVLDGTTAIPAVRAWSGTARPRHARRPPLPPAAVSTAAPVGTVADNGTCPAGVIGPGGCIVHCHTPGSAESPFFACRRRIRDSSARSSSMRLEGSNFASSGPCFAPTPHVESHRSWTSSISMLPHLRFT